METVSEYRYAGVSATKRSRQSVRKRSKTRFWRILFRLVSLYFAAPRLVSLGGSGAMIVQHRVRRVSHEGKAPEDWRSPRRWRAGRRSFARADDDASRQFCLLMWGTCGRFCVARAHGMWTYESRQGRNAATAVCSASAVVTLALSIFDCGLAIF